MAKRVQSPSSIKVYNHCPKKYFYQYVMKLDTKSNIHLFMGSVIHDVLEQFFEINTEDITEQYLKKRVQELLVRNWGNKIKDLKSLNLRKKEEVQRFDESLLMVFNWVKMFIIKMKNTGLSLKEAFHTLKPKETEQRYRSDTHSVQGIIDAIEQVEGKIRIMDYKTSSSFDLSEHKIQLAIYSLLYYEKNRVLPDKAGIYFLRGSEKTIEVDEELIETAKKEINAIHINTLSGDTKDYPKKPGPLCKWSTGQCDFYNICKPFGEDIVRIKNSDSAA